jgi:PKD repeat protein
MAISGNIPLTVEFTNTSTGDNLTYLWDFGDGNTSTQQNPSHEYVVAGNYTVTLTTTNNYGSDVKTDTVSATSAADKQGDGKFDSPKDLISDIESMDVKSDGKEGDGVLSLVK